MDDFFGSGSTDTKVLRDDANDVELRPPPPPPKGFSGLVGSFDIEASMSKRHLEVGESATLRLTVSGTGNVQMINEPELAELPSFKVYGDQPERSINRSGRSLTGSRSFSKALVPLEPGEWILPSVEIVYFDPVDASFQTDRTEEIALTVIPGEGAEDLHLTESIAPSTGKVAVRILADDILPIYGELDAVSNPSSPRRSTLLFLLASVLPLGLYLTGRAVQRHRWRLQHDVAFQRHRTAYRRARKQLRKLPESESDPVRLGQSISLCLREYIGDKLDQEGAALTPGELHERLEAHGVSEALAAETHDLLERLEAAQFGAVSLKSENLPERASELLARLEGELKK
jgi:hypothetical protein